MGVRRPGVPGPSPTRRCRLPRSPPHTPLPRSGDPRTVRAPARIPHGLRSRAIRRTVSRRRLEGRHALADRVPGQFGDAVEIELAHDVAAVGLDGACRDAHPLGDLAGRQSFRQEVERRLHGARARSGCPRSSPSAAARAPQAGHNALSLSRIRRLAPSGPSQNGGLLRRKSGSGSKASSSGHWPRPRPWLGPLLDTGCRVPEIPRSLPPEPHGILTRPGREQEGWGWASQGWRAADRGGIA
jgi:hypothetical protein